MGYIQGHDGLRQRLLCGGQKLNLAARRMGYLNQLAARELLLGTRA